MNPLSQGLPLLVARLAATYTRRFTWSENGQAGTALLGLLNHRHPAVGEHQDRERSQREDEPSPAASHPTVDTAQRRHHGRERERIRIAEEAVPPPVVEPDQLGDDARGQQDHRGREQRCADGGPATAIDDRGAGEDERAEAGGGDDVEVRHHAERARDEHPHGGGQQPTCRRAHGPVVLDLLHREGWVGRHRLGLHPREFALLWRLAENPGVPVPPGILLSEVWHLAHRPETNSLAVHVCRLRAKLAGAGLADLLHTSPGGYLLSPVAEEAAAGGGEAEAGAGASIANNRVAMPGACR